MGISGPTGTDSASTRPGLRLSYAPICVAKALNKKEKGAEAPLSYASKLSRLGKAIEAGAAADLGQLG